MESIVVLTWTLAGILIGGVVGVIMATVRVNKVAEVLDNDQ